MDKKALTTVTFKENCEYQSSTISRNIIFPQQIVQVELKPIENQENNRVDKNGNLIFCYDDKIKLEAHVTYENSNTDVQTGRIEFYFIPEGTITPLLINKPTFASKTCELNSNGNAAVFFKPTSSGDFFARYIDDNNIYATTDSSKQSLLLQGIPVKIEFEHLPPYITNIHDEIKIKVHVTNALDGTNIKYGLVTFLHYLVKNDNDTPSLRVPKVIGNPVPVLNGYAEISYIPVQSDDYGYNDTLQDTEPEILIENSHKRCVEYIRASYNYSGKYVDTDKGEYKWEYYNTKSEWTAINVLARNTINVNPPKVNNTTLSLDGESGIYQCQESDIITLSAILKDKNNEIINFTKDDIGTLIFHIKGTHPHPKQLYAQNAIPEIYENDQMQTNAEINFLTYEKDIEVELNSDGHFTTTIKKLLPGFYEISATTTIITKKSNDLPLIEYDGEPYIENDKKYAQVTNSNVIYISSKYTDINHIITLTHDTYLNQVGEKLNNLSGTVTQLTNNQMNILDNKPCYFYISETNNTYRGTLTYNRNSNKLIGEPSQDIIFNSPDNYHIYMYIPAGVYTNNTSITSYHHDITSENDNSVYDFYLPYHPSVPITIQSRDTIELNLSIETITNTPPANFSYTLQGKYVMKEEVIDLFIQSTSSIEEEVIKNNISLFKEYYIATGDFEINEPGEYEIWARTKDGKSESNKVIIEVGKEKLEQTLLESSKEMFASSTNTIGVYLTCQQSDINLLDKTYIKAYLYDKDKTLVNEVTFKNNKIIDKNTLFLEIIPGIWKEETWYIQVTYEKEDDNIFLKYDGILEEFKSVLDTPIITMTPSYGDYLVDINGPHRMSDNYIIAKVAFYDNKTKLEEGIFITNDIGSGYFGDPSDGISHLPMSWWSKWNNIVFTFNPYDTELIQILKNNSSPYRALEQKYGNVFDHLYLSNDESHPLYNQLRNNNYNYVFKTYKPSEIKITRPASL